MTSEGIMLTRFPPDQYKLQTRLHAVRFTHAYGIPTNPKTTDSTNELAWALFRAQMRLPCLKMVKSLRIGEEESLSQPVGRHLTRDAEQTIYVLQHI